MQDYLWKYPNGKYAANANYWLGELHLRKWQNNKKDTLSLDKATQSFTAVQENNAKHQKAKDALLKLGMIAEEQGNTKTARNIYNKVIKIKPNSSTANIAKLKLKDIK